MNDLTSRLNAIRTKSRGYKSEYTNQSTLITFLSIYTMAERSCCINYMAGAKALYNFLTEENQGLDLQLESFPEILNSEFKVPQLFYSYEMQELAKIFAGPRERYDSIDSYLFAISKFAKAIYITLVHMELNND